MTEAYIGELRCFAFNFAPSGWLSCQGQLLPISQFTALFSLLGTYYGGNGQTTFALPDLQGRGALGQGRSASGSNYQMGQVGGSETVTLTTAQLPAHNHPATGSSGASSKSPGGNVPGYTAGGSSYADTLDTPMNSQLVGMTGDNQAHDNMSPYQVLNWCIATQGIYPSRP